MESVSFFRNRRRLTLLIGADIDCAQLQKIYGEPSDLLPEDNRRATGVREVQPPPECERQKKYERRTGIGSFAFLR